MRSRKQLRSEDDSNPVERVEHERGGQSASQCRLAIVPDFVAVPRIAKVAEGKYQVGELGAYVVEGEQVFESPEKPFTTTDLVPVRSIEFRCGNGPTERLASGG